MEGENVFAIGINVGEQIRKGTSGIQGMECSQVVRRASEVFVAGGISG